MDFERLGLMLDMSRNSVMNVPALKEYISLLAEMGYNALMLYTEDTYEIPGEPYFGHFRGRYSLQEMKVFIFIMSKKAKCLMHLILIQIILHKP